MQINYSTCSQCRADTVTVVVLQDVRTDGSKKLPPYSYVSEELTICEACLETALEKIRKHQAKGV